MMGQEQIFLIGQKAFIRKGSEVLVLFRPDGQVDFPGGKVQVGEDDFDEALRREVREESSLEIEVGAPFVRWLNPHKISSLNTKGLDVGDLRLCLVGLACSYSAGEVNLSEEHRSYKWVDVNNYKELDDGSGHFAALELYFGLYK